MSNLHTELYPALADVTTKMHEADAELGSTLAHFATQVSPKLSADERDHLATILHRAYALQPVADTQVHPKHQMALGGGLDMADHTSTPQAPQSTI